MTELKIPVGSSDFQKIRENGFYYVDKTGLIEELLKMPGVAARVITRPRRFGKTLNMSMLYHFFDIQKESKALFKGLKVSENE